MKSRLSLLTAFYLLLFAASPAARAADADGEADNAQFLSRLFGAMPRQNEKTYACFVRVYDARHFARHPKQKVKSMKLLVTAEGTPEDAGNVYSFRLGLSYRNRRGAFDSSGECRSAVLQEKPGEHETRLGCSVDCDGGGIGVGLSKDDRAAILSVERVRIWRNNRPDEEASYSLEAGQDDRVFRLERVDSRQCASLVTDREELAAMRTKK